MWQTYVCNKNLISDRMLPIPVSLLGHQLLRCMLTKLTLLSKILRNSIKLYAKYARKILLIKVKEFVII